MRNSVFCFLLIFIFSCTTKVNQNQKEPLSTDLVNVSASATEDKTNTKMPIMYFEEKEHDFGTISQGEKVSYAFKFKNTGYSDLIISSATGSCGCTVPRYPKGPVPAGTEGVIDVVFNSEGKSGKVQKTVTLISNAEPNTTILTISANIIVKTN